MTTIGLLESLRARDILITADDDELSVDAPVGALTDEDRARLRECKAELLAILRGDVTPSRIRENSASGHAHGSERDPLHPENESGANVAKSETGAVHRRPRLGSISRPCPVRGARLIGCPWHTCAGVLVRHGHELYECQDCGTWFRRLAPDVDPLRDPGVNLGAEAVADDGQAFDGANEIGWLM